MPTPKPVNWKRVADRMKSTYEKEFWSNLFQSYSDSHPNARAVAIAVYKRALKREKKARKA